MPGPTLGSEVTEAKKTGSLLLEEFIVWGRVLVVWGGWGSRVGGSLLFGVIQISMRGEQTTYLRPAQKGWKVKSVTSKALARQSFHKL